MKRIFLLSIISLFLYSCVGDIPTDLNKGGDKTEYANLIIANTDYYNSTLNFLCEDMVIPEVSYRSKIKVPYPILSDNTYKVSYKDVLGERHIVYLGNLEANKTYILTVLKVLSAVSGLVLNIFLIKKLGLIGVGVATLSSNILYFVLTLTVTLPNLEWKAPYKKIIHIFICFIPFSIIWYFLQRTSVIPILQINILLFSYYLLFYMTRKFFREVLS